MRAFRLAIVSAAFVVGLAAPVAAQTTTTMPPVRSIPVTSGTPTTTAAPATTTTTAAPATNGQVAAGATDANGNPLASTGIAADKLVPFGFLLIGLGAALTGASRRPRRTAYTFL